MLVPAFRQTCHQILKDVLRLSPRRQRRPGRHDRPLVVESLEARTLLTGTWTPLTHLAPDSIGTMLLLSDGTIMAQNTGASANWNRWYRLTPDASGSYVDGTWSNLASMGLQRLYYGSAVLPDGRVFVVGGEYSGSSGQPNDTNMGEIYDPLANSWTPIPNFPQNRFGDNSTVVLPDGRILAGYLNGAQTYIFDPATSSWTATGTKLRADPSSEESWVKLPDDSILSYDIWASTPTLGHAQRYIPSTGQWVDAGTVPVLLSGSSAGEELGPGLLLPDGRAWFLGATGHTAFYDPATNSWTAGDDIPAGLSTDDAPGAVLPNGHVLFAADRLLYHAPMHLFDYDPVANTYEDVTPPSSVISTMSAAYTGRMLMLPTGQVLLTTGGNKLAVYNPDSGPLTSAQPAINSIDANADGSFTLTGTQLNGINEGASYGDDAQMASNYPIVQLTDAGGSVSYARTFNWSSTSVATGDTPVTTQFTLPAGLPGGAYSVVVIANGIASDPVSYNFGATRFSVVPSTDSVTAGTPFTITVTALDANDNPVPNYQGTVRFRSNDPQGLLPPRYTFTVDDSGTHTFTVTLATAGTRHITVRDTVTHSIKGRATIIVTPAPAVTLQLVAPASIPVGVPFEVTVIAQDPYGNTDTNYLGSISFSTSDPGGVLLPADYTFTSADAGMVTIPGFILMTPGDQILTATDTDSGITGSVTITVLPGPLPRRRDHKTEQALAIAARSIPADTAETQASLGRVEVDRFFATSTNDPRWTPPQLFELVWRQRSALTAENFDEANALMAVRDHKTARQ